MNQQTKSPGLVNWTGYLALMLLLTIPLSVLIVRSGAWQQGLLLYAIACLGSALLILLSLILLLLPRLAQWRKKIASNALFALPGAAFCTRRGRSDHLPRRDHRDGTNCQ